MTILSGNRTVNEFEGATRARELAQRRLEEKIANNRAIAELHRRGTAAEPSVSFDGGVKQDGKVTVPGG